MILHILQGNEQGMVKEFDEYGGRHAVQTGFAREATKAETKQFKTAAKALTAAAEGPQAETPEKPKKPSRKRTKKG